MNEEKITIIIADDNKYVVEFIVKEINKNKTKFHILGTTKSTEEEFKLIAKYKPDVVITDLRRNNSKESGVDVIRFYKDKEYCPRFIVISAAPYGSMFLPQEQLPIEKYIVKPFDFLLITQTLEDVRSNIYPKEVIKVSKNTELINNHNLVINFFNIFNKKIHK